MRNIVSLKKLLCLGIAIGGFIAAPALDDPLSTDS